MKHSRLHVDVLEDLEEDDTRDYVENLGPDDTRGCIECLKDN